MDELITLDNNSKNDNSKCRLNTPSGVIHCDKDHGSPITMHGYLPHFSQYLHESGQPVRGNEGTMAGCEERGLLFLFKLKQSGKIKKLLSELDPPRA